MRIDISPYYRSTVGFDRLFDLLDTASQYDTPAYPPYNIERTGESAYRIVMAVAGFGENDLNVEVKENVLTVSGRRPAEEEKKAYLHQGIAGRNFERRFQLADYVQVKGAKLENGLLHIALERVVPEEKRTRRIAIAGEKSKVIESKAA